jgi:O-antigen/teichoic acid export membrane protein
MLAYKGVSGISAAAIIVVTARALGPTGRGVLVLLFTLATITYLACTLGVNTAARVHLVAKDSPVASGDYVGLVLALTVMQTLVCAGVGAVLLPVVSVHLSAVQELPYAVLGGTLLAQYMLMDGLNAYGRTTLATAIDAAGSATQLLLVVVLAFGHARTVTPYILALTGGNLLQIGLSLAYLSRIGVPVRPRYRRPSWVLLLRSGAPGTALAMAQMLTFRLDRYLVGALMDPKAVGVYSVAVTLPELLRLPSVALSQTVFYRLAAGLGTVEDFRRVRMWCLAVPAALSAVAFVVAPALLRAIFGDTYLAAVTPMRILLFAEVGVSVFYLDGFSLAGIGRLGDAAVSAVVGLVIVTLLDLVMIPAYGLAGAAWASAIGYSIMGVVALVLLGRRVARPAGGDPQPAALPAGQ